MFEVADERQAGIPWGVIGGIAALGMLLVAGYFMIS